MDADLAFGPGDRSRGPAAGMSLAARVAAALQDKIRSGSLPDGARLPTEHALAQHFGVSRTVIREAIAALKAEGLVETRQGSGAYLRRPDPTRIEAAFRIDPLTRAAVGNLLQLIEVRRVIEAEIAALAATQRSAGQLAEIHRALARIDASEGDGVEEDVGFHLALARATGNPYWAGMVEMFAGQLRTAVTVTRANEARRRDFAEQVRGEHARICQAVAAGDPDAAREAAAEHMAQAAARVIAADQEFWTREGGEYARRLGREPG
jgi:GntR family transcriptional regulator, transcriptional repressor for pyruvate dehydrogenase complex